MEKKNKRIFSGFVILTFTAMILIESYLILMFYQTGRKITRDLGNRASSVAAIQANDFVEKAIDVLTIISEQIEDKQKENLSPEEIEKIFSYLNEQYAKVYKKYTNSQFVGLYGFLETDEGILYLGKNQVKLPPDYNPRERPWYIKAVEAKGRITLVSPYKRVYAAPPAITICKLLSDGKSVLAMDITLSHFQKIANEMAFNITVFNTPNRFGYGFIMDDEGLVIAHFDPKHNFQNFLKSDDPEMRKLAGKLKENENIFTMELYGQDVVVYNEKIAQKWIVATIVNTTNFFASFKKFIMLIFMTSMVIFGLICFLGYTLMKRMDTAERLSVRDSLTGVKNRTAYDIETKKMDEKLKNDKSINFAVAAFDVNHLKLVNDTLGHEKGDKLLSLATKLICDTFKRSPVFRIGGDEFVAILSSYDYKEREGLIDEMRKKMEALKESDLPLEEKVSIASGIAEYRNGIDLSYDDVAKRADEAMYLNKKEMKEEREKY